MKTALIQTTLFWENPTENRRHITQKINDLPANVDLIVLPEMFSSGFTMNPKAVAETRNGETITGLQQLAKAKNCAITGSLVIEENGKFYNRLVFIFPNGEVQHYNKRHLFTLANENLHFEAGNQRTVFSYRGIRIMPQVCYDLRFPVFSRNKNDYDLLIYVANWPETRITAWDALLKARAIENMSAVIGVNRIGTDGKNLKYPGHSKCVDCLGNVQADLQNHDRTEIVEIDFEFQQQQREKLAFLNDADDFELR